MAAPAGCGTVDGRLRMVLLAASQVSETMARVALKSPSGEPVST